MSSYKPSKYNIVTQSKSGEILVQNHLYNTHIKIACSDKEAAQTILTQGTCCNYKSVLWKEAVKEKIVVPVNIDEKRLVDYQCNSIIYSNDLLHLSIIPTDGCNFKCKYCYEGGPAHFMSEETTEALKRYITKAAKKYKGMYIAWYGGEPTLAGNRVIDIMQHAKKVCCANHIPLYGQMTTNGYLLSDDLFQKLLENHVMSYMVTLDGTRETHNAQRPHKQDRDSYSMILNNLRSIRDNIHNRNFRIGIRINISPNILPYLKEYVDLVAAEFGDDMRFGIIWEWVKDWGGEQIYDNYDLVMQSYDSTEYDQYLDYITEKGVVLDRGQAHCQLGSEMCIASRKNGFTINYDGKVYKCAMGIFSPELDAVNCIGQLLPNGEIEIDEYLNALWVGQGDIPDSCGECKHYPECMGLICPLAIKIRKVFLCPQTLHKEEGYIARNIEKFGGFGK